MPRAKQPRDVGKARQLRATMSLPEVLMWQQLRLQSEVKFRRQHPIGPYVLDFYCVQANVCIEIDGIAHDTNNRPERDATRDEWLAAHGIEVVRIAASEVLANPQKIAENLTLYCAR